MCAKSLSKLNIAILTTVVNFLLYEKTSKFFPQGIQKYVIDGRNGMHGIDSIYYMFDKLSKSNIDYLILADEDVIFKDGNIVFSIINKMIKDDFDVCGVRDGGVIKHRIYNPEMVNTFFTIINFKKILSIWSKREIKRNQYILPNEFKFQGSLVKGKYDENSLYEPYYCFFLWLKRKNMKFLYLDSEMLDDEIANTIIFDHTIFACHTWYARSYTVNEKHTKRIENLMLSINPELSKSIINLDVILFKDNFFFLRMKIKKIFRKVFNKIAPYLNDN